MLPNINIVLLSPDSWVLKLREAHQPAESSEKSFDKRKLPISQTDNYDIKESIIKELDSREAKATETIKANPRYFFSFAKRFAKTQSTVGPISDQESKTATYSQTPAVKQNF